MDRTISEQYRIVTKSEGEKVHPCPQKKAKEENSQSKIGRKQKKKIRNQRLEESKKERKIPDQRSDENKRNIQKGLWTRQYMNNT